MRPVVLFASLFVAIAGRAQDTCHVSLTGVPMTCPGDDNASLTVVQGDDGPYTFTWSHNASLHSATATGLSTGAYSVHVEGAQGCTADLDTVVEDPYVEPLGSMTVTNISCAGRTDGSVTFTVHPGPYVWHWLDVPSVTNTTRTGLGAGQYSVVVNGGDCPSYVSANLGDPDVHIDGHSSYCPSDLPLQLTSVNDWGFQPNVYLWSTGATTPDIPITLGLSGLITLTATDTTIGCTASGDFLLTPLAYPSALMSVPDSLCIGTLATAHVVQSTADSVVWHWGAQNTSTLTDPLIGFTEPDWQPITLQGFDTLGCGDLPVIDSIYVRPRLPAIFTAEQKPCTTVLDLHLASTSDSCAFFIGDELVLNACSGFFQLDLRRFEQYDLTFYSTRPDHCDDTLATRVELRTPPILALPNAFTPNGDGINDTWPGPIDIPDLSYQVQLFDRWGASLWATTDTQARWDGAGLPNGVYVYTMRMRDPCEPKQVVSKNGFVTLVR